ncbi:MAG: hypothetical protein ACPLZG_11310 [Thermoproteota archaeon]
MSEKGKAVNKDVDELKQIINEIDQILCKHEKFMTIKGANVYFALRELKKAKSYLQEELEILQRLSS